MEKILNLSRIREILDNEEEAVQEVLVMFVEGIPKFIAKVNKYMAEENLEQLKFTIHKFKSSCNLITAPTFIELVRTIEHSEATEMKVVKPLVDQLITYTYILEKEIRELKIAA